MDHAESISKRLASALGRRDQGPNVALAEDIVIERDKKAVKALVELLERGTKAERHDAIKVLYEVGALDPRLVQTHLSKLVAHLDTRDNRMLWGTLIAINSVVAGVPDKVAAHLAKILEAADRGSIIAKDKTVSILATLAADPRYTTKVAPLLLARVEAAADNQFPSYAEQAADVLPNRLRKKFVGILEARLEVMPYPAKQKRIEKVLAKLV